MNERNSKALGWKDFCSQECYGIAPHSHNFTIAVKIKEVCPRCQEELEPDAQSYMSGLGTGEAELVNYYKCDKCQEHPAKTIYKGPQESFVNFAAKASRAILSEQK